MASVTLGRVQGASLFFTTSKITETGPVYNLQISTLTPKNISPIVGDNVVFPTGDVRTITNVYETGVFSCGAVHTNVIVAARGEQGVSISSVTQTLTSDESGGPNEITVTLSNGSKSVFVVKNGQSGDAGLDGLVLKDEKVYISKEGQTIGEGVELPKGGSGGGSTNFILNPDFSVNQRGQEEYTGTQTVDCFKQNTEEGYIVKSIPTADGVELIATVEAKTREQGTAISAENIFEGTTATVYVNTDMDASAIEAIISDLTFTAQDMGEGYNVFGATSSTESGLLTKYLTILRLSGVGFVIVYGSPIFISSEAVVQAAAQMGIPGFDFVGWKEGFDGKIIVENLSVSDPPTAGQQNELVKSLFSASLFGIVTEQGKALFTQAIEDAKKLEGKTVTLSVNASVATQEGGTAVPNDGSYVEKIYFNTSMPKEEVTALIDEYCKKTAVGTNYVFAVNPDIDKAIEVTETSNYGSIIEYKGTHLFSDTEGWNASFNGIVEYNDVAIRGIEGVPVIFGLANKELIDLVSTTPNFGSAKGELLLGYTSKSEGSNEIGGTVVPNDGTFIESVYVNTSLTPDKVNAIIASANLSFVDYNGMPAYFMLLAGTTAIGVYNMGVGYGLGSVNLATGEMVTFFGTGLYDEYKWFDFTNPVEVNAASTNNMQGLPIGAENNKLLDIFSTTPNFGSGSSSGGTPVPNDGSLVETVYFNTAKTEAEWAAVASKLNFVEGFTDLPMYPVLVTTNGEALAVVHQTSLGRYFLGVSNMVTGTDTNIFVPNDFEGSPSVWQMSNYAFNANSQAVVQGVPVGTQNDLLIDFISTTPEFGSPSSGGVSGKFIPLKNGMNSLTFEAKGLKECGIYSSSNMIGTMPKYLGTPVPNDGSTIDKLYFNTSLTAEQVDAIIESANLPFAIIPFDDERPMYIVALFTKNGEMLDYLAVTKHEKGYSINGSLKMFGGTYYASNANVWGGSITLENVPWNSRLIEGGITKFDQALETIPPASDLTTLGVYNDKLAGLISTTPFDIPNPDYCDAKATINSIKLELGEEATAHLPVITNDEKVRCQRVYQPVSLSGVVGYAKDESTLAVSVPLPVSMRAVPSVENFETISILGGGEISGGPTPMPNDGLYVDKVYFNTSLPTDKVVEILSSLPYPAAGMYNYVFVANDESKVIVVEKRTDSSGTRYRIWDMVGGTHYFSSSSLAGDGIVGWYDFGGVIEVGKNAGALEGISVGTSNEKLVNLISVTPFEPELDKIAVDSIANNSVQISLTTSGLAVGNLYMVSDGKVCLSADEPHS